MKPKEQQLFLLYYLEMQTNNNDWFTNIQISFIDDQNGEKRNSDSVWEMLKDNYNNLN